MGIATTTVLVIKGPDLYNRAGLNSDDFVFGSFNK